MILPLLLIVLAIAAAAALAYGVSPAWGQYAHGVEWIVWCRQAQWMLVAVSLALCIGIIAWIASGRLRAWWLVGLAPVLYLFAHRFVQQSPYQAVEDPTFIAPADVNYLSDTDWVVGFELDHSAFAYPYAALFRTPVVIQPSPSRNRRYLLLWNADANLATAFEVDHDLHARELEVVSTPANALLVYNHRNGQFINGVTGRTSKGELPAGFHAQVQVMAMPWGQWRRLYPDTNVMKPNEMTREASEPIAPRFAMERPGSPGASTQPANGANLTTRVVLVATTRPVALLSDEVTPAALNPSGENKLLVFRDAFNGLVRAFDRRCDQDLFPVFARKSDPKRLNVQFRDRDSNSEWTAQGRAVEGPLKGTQLRSLVTFDGAYWGVLKHWRPDLQLTHVEPTPDARDDAPELRTPEGRSPATQSSGRRRKPS